MTLNSILGARLQMGPHVVDFHRSILGVARLIRNEICRKMPRGFRPFGHAAKNGVGFSLRQIPAALAVLSSDLWRSGGGVHLSPPKLSRGRSARPGAPGSAGGPA